MSRWALRKKFKIAKVEKYMAIWILQILLMIFLSKGEIDYWNHLDEMMEVYKVLEGNKYIRKGSVKYWFVDFFNEHCNITKEEELEDVDAFWYDYEDEQEQNCTHGKRVTKMWAKVLEVAGIWP